MPATASQIQAFIVLEVGDEAGVLADNLAAVWDSFADKAGAGPRLQELYAKRRCIDLVLGALRSQVDFTTDGQDLSFKAHQRIDTLNTMRKDVQTEIARVEQFAIAAGGPAVGQITTVAPITPPLPQPGPYLDANDQRYSGSPYVPGRTSP